MASVSSRRHFLQSVMATTVLGMRSRSSEARAADVFPPIRTITRGPKHHWFGYYDKLEFDPTNRYVLANEVAFEHRTPRMDDAIKVGMVDTQDADRWIDLGRSSGWGWQQGCMLQWRPESDTEVVWNDREGDRYVCRLKNVKSGQVRTLPRPIYTLSHDGRWALTADFSRIQRMRPGYGYVGLADPHAKQRAPDESGVWKMDMESGECTLVFSLADAARVKYQGESLLEKWNYFNHLLISPDNQRFIVLHRWRDSTGIGLNAEPTGGFTTRMFTVAFDGSERYILDPSGHTSHFIWRDPRHVCAWTRPSGRPAAFYLFTDQTSELQMVGEGVMTRNGHNTYLPLPGHHWVLNDTYPDKKTRKQTPYLFHIPTGRRIDLGHFYLDPKYNGQWRCDLHPRSSNDGKTVAIDSPHAGGGRQVHLIDVSEIVV